MKRIQALIQLLLAINLLEIQKGRDYFEHLLQKMRKQGVVMDQLRELALEEGTLIGRIICLGIGEFKCFYVITKVYPKVVQIDWLNYGDGWSDARAGQQALLDIKYAKAYIDFEDHQGGILPKAKIICPIITASPERLKEFMS